MIVAMQSLIPDRRAGSSEKKSVPPPTHPEIYAAAWLGEQQGKTTDPQPGPALAQEEDEPARPARPASPGVRGACRGACRGPSPPVPARRGNPLPARRETRRRPPA